jgi:flotillin
LREEEMQIQVVERTQQILVQEQEIIRKEKELDATVRRPAEAEKYRYNDVVSLVFHQP